MTERFDAKTGVGDFFGVETAVGEEDPGRAPPGVTGGCFGCDPAAPRAVGAGVEPGVVAAGALQV